MTVVVPTAAVGVSAVAAHCSKKRLIRLDDDLPLPGFDDVVYQGYLAQGSMALTAGGQQVLEHMENYGIGESETMLNYFSRTQILFGKDGMDKPYKVRGAVFSIGRVDEVVKNQLGW